MKYFIPACCLVLVFSLGVDLGLSAKSNDLFSKYIEYSDYDRLAMEVHDCFYKARATAALEWDSNYRPIGVISCNADKEGVCKEVIHDYDYVHLLPNPQETVDLDPTPDGKGNAMGIGK